EGEIVLGFIGSFYAYEGIPFILDAFPEILKRQPNISLLLVGGGPQEQLIKDKVKQLHLESNVVFTGRVPHDQVQEYYNQVDIFVYPRLAMRLTELVTPLKPLEAMAQGRLVVASDVGGHKELIENQRNGYLFKANDKKALVDTLSDFLDNQSHWEEMRKNGRDFVEQQRNWPVSVARYENVYTQLIKKFG
ncbi:MAG: glycosyltransferase, partial [Methylomarinum sp.]|nr:glycosyltransferase [Methylomarinum sp.]